MSEEEFLPALRKAFEDHKVNNVPGWLSVEDGDAPALPKCAAEPWGRCPTENEWCTLGLAIGIKVKSISQKSKAKSKK